MLLRTVAHRHTRQLGRYSRILNQRQSAFPQYHFRTGSGLNSIQRAPFTTDSDERVGIVDLMQEVARRQQENIVNVVPWFVKNMPQNYFRVIPEAVRIRHLESIASIHDLGVFLSFIAG
jgi:hypothetical protein